MDKIWLQYYQKDVPTSIDPHRFESLVDLFNHTCENFSERKAYTNMGVSLTYAELDRLSLVFASYLQQLGLKKGARVAIMMPNLLQYPVVLFAIMRAGYIVVNTNPLYTPDEVVHQMNDSGAEVMIVLANVAHTVEKALVNMPLLKHIIITEIGDLFPWLKKTLINTAVRYLKKMIPAFNIPKAHSFSQALDIGQKRSFSKVEIKSSDTAFLQYTGGTTGVAKGAVLTHQNMVANVEQAFAWITPLDIGKDDIIVTALPLYHIFSLTANCLTFLKAGAENVLITNPRDLKRFIKEITNIKFTTITGVNTLFSALLNQKMFKKVDFSRLKLALSGGMALQESVATRWHKLTKSPILEAYGLTETSPAVTINPMYLEEYNGSIGLPLSSTDVSIRDEDGKEVSLGQDGELSVKGPQVMQEYWRRSDETELVFWPDGFLRTGDIVKMDEKGFIYLVDRKKDMIVVSGFNVYPNEIEHVIGMLDGVLEVGVIGELDDRSGEKIKACIVRSDPSLTKKAILQHCREHLTAYKIPKIIEFCDDLPKTNVGKILRRALRKPSFKNKE